MRNRFLISIFVAVIFYTSISIVVGMNRQKETPNKNVASSPKEQTENINTIIPTLAPTTPPTPTPPPRTIPEDELISAINEFRKAQGKGALSRNEGLCTEARKRTEDLLLLFDQNDRIVLNHDGFKADVESGRLTELTGKYAFGENVASAYCKRTNDSVNVSVSNGTQLVEWCFESSTGHRENMLNPDWTDVCSSGQFPIYVQIFSR